MRSHEYTYTIIVGFYDTRGIVEDTNTENAHTISVLELLKKKGARHETNNAKDEARGCSERRVRQGGGGGITQNH